MRLYGSVSGDLSEDRGKEKSKQKMRCFFVGDAILSYTIQLYRDCFTNHEILIPIDQLAFAWKVIVFFCVAQMVSKCITGLKKKQLFVWSLEPLWDLCGCENGCFSFDFPSQ